MAAKPPDAFLSCTRFDDRHDGDAISALCRRLASAVQAVTGIPFEIFQDVEGIGIGGEKVPDTFSPDTFSPGTPMVAEPGAGGIAYCVPRTPIAYCVPRTLRIVSPEPPD